MLQPPERGPGCYIFALKYLKVGEGLSPVPLDDSGRYVPTADGVMPPRAMLPVYGFTLGFGTALHLATVGAGNSMPKRKPFPAIPFEHAALPRAIWDEAPLAWVESHQGSNQARNWPVGPTKEPSSAADGSGSEAARVSGDPWQVWPISPDAGFSSATDSARGARSAAHGGPLQL